MSSLIRAFFVIAAVSCFSVGCAKTPNVQPEASDTEASNIFEDAVPAAQDATPTSPSVQVTSDCGDSAGG